MEGWFEMALIPVGRRCRLESRQGNPTVHAASDGQSPVPESLAGLVALDFAESLRLDYRAGSLPHRGPNDGA